jgi:centromeric protein E
VHVYVRIRPEREDNHAIKVSSSTGSLPSNSNKNKCVTLQDESTIRITPPDGVLGSRKTVTAVDDKIFNFDKVFPENSSQEDIYKSVSSLVRATVRGYNTTIFAYGSTGSGKSFTMTGNSSAPGIVPRAISEIFSIIEDTASQESDVYFYVRISYVELYNNNFRNLLEFASKELGEKEKNDSRFDIVESRERESVSFENGLRSTSPSHANHRADKIEVRESQSAGVFLAGPNLRIPVTSAQEAFQLIARGNRSRAVGSTQCNDVSSR